MSSIHVLFVFSAARPECWLYEKGEEDLLSGSQGEHMNQPEAFSLSQQRVDVFMRLQQRSNTSELQRQ